MAKVGETLPTLVLEAAATQRSLSLPKHGADVLVIMFYSQNEVEQAKQILMHLRQQYHDVEKLKIINIIDATALPRFMRGIAKGRINSIYEGAAKEVPDAFDPADVLFFTVDWDGALHQQFAVPTKHGLQIMLADATGQVVHKEATPQIKELLAYVGKVLA